MKLIKEIQSKDGILHFKRWRVLKTKWFEIYLHGIYSEDKDKHCHNHPWNMTTIVLFGSYIEKIITKKSQYPSHKRNIRTFLHISNHKSDQYHMVEALFTSRVYSLAIVGKRHNQNWGYFVDGHHINNDQYRELKSK